MTETDIRLLAVERFKSLDLENDSEFRELVQMASDVCDTPIALLTLLDHDTQWLKVRKGTDIASMPREISFCDHTIRDDSVMIVPDATADERFTNNPIVASDPHIRFYAGASLITNDGHRIGSLCVIDLEPHQLTRQQELLLKMLSKQAVNLMEYRISAELLEKNKIEFERQKKIIREVQITQRSFFESAPNFHALLGKRGEVIDFNKIAYNFIHKVHGVELRRGVMMLRYIAPDFADKFIRGFNMAVVGDHAFEEGSTDYGAHGVIYWEASFETARDPNNEIIGISYIIRDVTDRKVREHKIIDQNQSLLKIAHMQAHEFRAPLTTITGMMDLIKAEDYQAPKEYFELLENAVKNLDGKIREVVDNVDNIVLEGTEVYKA
ncbi:GAF domain-containing protein [Mucilaginibacter ginsenosidivorans]|uniref:histidine kinase n=1 Tax=Mucilaginibacter ginsenosidivorans TaxID=398053 RepID=A0A5B8USJ2_9SPHI|nr:GAF domain-containing protein [Mucilaginibacter ginsenosidivorans]QEC61892.1 GAF domain-containing protein [Mucilaginibacter ginsenosidivorans]